MQFTALFEQSALSRIGPAGSRGPSNYRDFRPVKVDRLQRATVNCEEDWPRIYKNDLAHEIMIFYFCYISKYSVYIRLSTQKYVFYSKALWVPTIHYKTIFMFYFCTISCFSFTHFLLRVKLISISLERRKLTMTSGTTAKNLSAICTF